MDHQNCTNCLINKLINDKLFAGGKIVNVKSLKSFLTSFIFPDDFRAVVIIQGFIFSARSTVARVSLSSVASSLPSLV